jgi:hypothetical protein
MALCVASEYIAINGRIIAFTFAYGISSQKAMRVLA